jgi:single-strand DNA-binding protein
MKNQVNLIGNVGQIETNEVKDGVKKAVLSLATSETYKDKDGQKQTVTQWHRVVLWRGLAEIVEKYVKKGALLSIDGKIEYSEYTDKDNVKRYSTEIKATNLLMIPTGKKEEETNK